MKPIVLSFILILLLVHIAHAETTGSISIGQPVQPQVTAAEINESAAGMPEEDNSVYFIAIIALVVVLTLAAKAYLFRRHK